MLIDPAKKTVYASKVVPHETRPGLFVLMALNGNAISYRGGELFSEQPPNFDGGNETCAINGNVATYRVDPEPTSVCFQVIEGL